MKIPNRVRYINKVFTNRLMGLIAGKRFSPIAVLHHTGRKSGKAYAIPIIAAPVSDGFVFALTYGDHVDWYRNILANNRARLTLHAREYALHEVSRLTAEKGQSSFHQPFQAILGLIEMEDFIHMKTV